MFPDHLKKFSTDNPVDYEQAFFSDVVCRVSRKNNKKKTQNSRWEWLYNLMLNTILTLTLKQSVNSFADLSLFSTKTLVETNGEHQVEVRTQV